MAFQDLRDFMAFLEKKGQLQRITAPVSAELEITEIADRVVKAGGPALLFENVRGYDMPVVINLFGSEERMSWALGVDSLDELGARIKKWLDLVQNRPPEGIIEKAKLLPELAQLARIGPHTVGHAPCQEVVVTDKPSVAHLPILKCWPQDGGQYLTLTMCHSKDPETGKRNIGMYRVQVYDERTVGMHWQIHKGGAATSATPKRRVARRSGWRSPSSSAPTPPASTPPARRCRLAWMSCSSLASCAIRAWRWCSARRWT